MLGGGQMGLTPKAASHHLGKQPHGTGLCHDHLARSGAWDALGIEVDQVSAVGLVYRFVKPEGGDVVHQHGLKPRDIVVGQLRIIGATRGGEETNATDQYTQRSRQGSWGDGCPTHGSSLQYYGSDARIRSWQRLLWQPNRASRVFGSNTRHHRKWPSRPQRGKDLRETPTASRRGSYGGRR